MEDTERDAIAGVWNAVTGSAWGFTLATAVNLLPDLDAWTVATGDDGSGVLIGVCGSRLLCLSRASGDAVGFATTAIPAEAVGIGVTDQFTQIRTAGGGHAQAAQHIRVWTFDLSATKATTTITQEVGGESSKGADTWNHCAPMEGLDRRCQDVLLALARNGRSA